MNARILLVEDEKALQLALSGLLRRQGYEVEVAGTGEDAFSQLDDASFDLVLTDLALGRGASGMDVLRRTKELRPETVVVMITAHGAERVAVEAMKAGADDYVPKPFDNDELDGRATRPTLEYSLALRFVTQFIGMLARAEYSRRPLTTDIYIAS